jgi:hypothetical protein
MVQAGPGRVGVGRPEQRNAVVVAVAAQEDGTAGHQVVATGVGNLEPEHVGNEQTRAFDVADIQCDAADPAQWEGRLCGCHDDFPPVARLYHGL